MTSTLRDMGPSVHTTCNAHRGSPHLHQAPCREGSHSIADTPTFVLHIEEGVPASTASSPSCTMLPVRG